MSLRTADLSAFRAALASMPGAADDSERVDRIRALEELRSAVAAAQAVEVAAFAASQRAAQLAAGVPAARVGRGVAAQVGLAARCSHHRSERFTGWATIVTTELPATFAALQQGRVSEWRAMIVARETGWLSREHRCAVDAALAPDLERLSDRQVEANTKTAAYRLDPHGYTRRLAAAEAERRVGLRPAPEVMARLTALLPMPQAVAAYAALRRHADTLISDGDPRNRGQLMADALIERLTGQATADAVPLELDLIITDTALFNGHPLAPADTDEPTDTDDTDDETEDDETGDDETGDDETGDDETEDDETEDDETEDDETEDEATEDDKPEDGPALPELVAAANRDAGRDEPAMLLGYGPVPATWARRLIHHTPDTTPIWIRRLYRHPTTGHLAALDSTRRLFTPAQRRFLRIRDHDTCRTPWCDAPARHHDHIHPHHDGGPTTTSNGQALCAACNHAKQAPGWTTTTNNKPSNSDHNTGGVTITTPTGHTYQHHPPDLPGTTTGQPAPIPAPRQTETPPAEPRSRTPWADLASPVERLLADLLHHAA